MPPSDSNVLDDDPALPPTTLRSIVADVTSEIIADHGVFATGEFRFVGVTECRRCAAPADCLPLDRVLDTGPDEVGHLHWVSPAGLDSAEPSTAPPIDPAVLGGLIAAHVARDLLDIRLVQRERDIDNLRVALETNRAIGVAVGVVMATRRCTADDAMDVLRAASQSQNRKLRDIAFEVQYTGLMPRTSRTASRHRAATR